ncbi:TraB/GumN family protein [Pseudohalocynthiibacter aestuariivivens]|nr:TraB/GumN family protein [Pseudohalocynthiibacter aestuariivivens]
MKLSCCLLSCLLLLPLPAAARCKGSDLIDALSDGQRAALEQAAEATPYAEGLLWRATRGDTRITLFGTYHFEHAQTQTHLAALEPMIKAADLVYLEMSKADEKRLGRQMASDPSLMFITEGPTLPDLLGDEDWQTLSDELSRRGFPSFLAAKFKPIWASMMLGIGPCEARSGALEAAGIDSLIGEHATQLGHETRSLEDAATVLTLLDGFPLEDQLDAIRLFLHWNVDPDDVAYTLRERYLAQQIALIWEYSRLISLEGGGPEAEASFALSEQVLLTDRNLAWADLLASDAVQGDVLVAAGAAHLPGDFGVLNLLAQRGFVISRLPFQQ